MKILSVVGARPQFIKAAPVSTAVRAAGHTEILVHTGQHYDRDMSDVFFNEMSIPAPDYCLGVGSGSHGSQTGCMLERIEEVLIKESPDCVLVYGDTNSTLAGALAAAKLHIPIAHVEAGLRSFNREMPEEHNRVLTDHCSDLLFCPTQTAVNNLKNEGITNGVHKVGDTMYDAVLQFVAIAEQKSTIMDMLGLAPKEFLLATVHRPYNTDKPKNLDGILGAFLAIDEPVVFPVHPRTRQKIRVFNGRLTSKVSNSNIRMIDPLGYLDLLILEKNARLILTDSGGMQKEAYFLQTPCVTLRPETEWVETVESGWNTLAGNAKNAIISAVKNCTVPRTFPNALFGDGTGAIKISSLLSRYRNAIPANGV